MIPSTCDPATAKQNLATCVVSDIYHGMEGVKRGTIKYIRILEQIPRPWAARRNWGGDVYDQQHATITMKSHLGLKVQHGVVPVESDGSAHFLVPAMANVSFQALDTNHMAVQTERTYVNYMPGETRSCIGCHETPSSTPSGFHKKVPLALKRSASVPGPQPGENSGQRPIDFVADVQPVLDRHCVSCHGGRSDRIAAPDLTGTMTERFSKSYESLMHHGLFPVVGENHPKIGNVHYMPARSFGSYNSVLVAMLAPDKVRLTDPKLAASVAKLVEAHKELRLNPADLLKITNWVDTNGQYYGMYWGRRNLNYREHPNFRPVSTFERATSYKSLITEEER